MLISGDIVDLDLGLPTGHEAGFPHPAVVVTAQEILDQGPSVIQVVPLASSIRGYGSEVTVGSDSGGSGLDRPSAAQCQHIRAVSPARILHRRGTVGPVDLARIREVLALILDIPG